MYIHVRHLYCKSFLGRQGVRLLSDSSRGREKGKGKKREKRKRGKRKERRCLESRLQRLFYIIKKNHDSTFLITGES